MLICRSSKVYISSANVDMRKSIDGLSSIVEQNFKLDPLSDAIFVFYNRHCDKVNFCTGTATGSVCCTNALNKANFIFQKLSIPINIR